MSSLAVVGFVLSFFTMLIGLVISIIALVRIRKTKERGKGLAIAGICIALIFSVVAGGFTALVANEAKKTARTQKNVERLVARGKDYRVAIDAYNTLVTAYNKGAGVRALADPQDTQADRDQAQKNAAVIKQVETEVEHSLTVLQSAKVFSQDSGAKKRLDTVQAAWATNKESLDEMIAGYTALAAGSVTGYNNFVDKQQGVIDSDQAFIKAAGSLGDYLQQKGDALGTQVDSLQK
jgi:hypothetical protein